MLLIPRWGVAGAAFTSASVVLIKNGVCLFFIWLKLNILLLPYPSRLKPSEMEAPHYRRMLLKLSRRFAPFILSYAFYLLILGLSLGWSPDPAQGVANIFKPCLYFVIFLMAAGFVADQNPHLIARTIYGAVIVGTLLFLGVAVMIFAELNRNLILEYYVAIRNADAASLQFHFYPTLFNYKGNQEARNIFDENYFGSPLRNTLIGCFILFFVLLHIYKPIFREKRRTSSRSRRFFFRSFSR